VKILIIFTLGIAMLVISNCSADENHPPVITNIIVSDNPIEMGETTRLEAVADDPDGDILTYEWTAPFGSFSTMTDCSTSWTAPNDTGNFQINIKVEDEFNASDESLTYIRVTEPIIWYHDTITAVNNNTYPIYDFMYTYSSASINGLPNGSEIESVYINVSITHTSYTDFDVWLYSPAGNYAFLWNNDYNPTNNYDSTAYIFNTEDPVGTWTLEIYDGEPDNSGELTGWYATIYYRYQQ
jgi:subtilisin-like proprotein convertase family protein